MIKRQTMVTAALAREKLLPTVLEDGQQDYHARMAVWHKVPQSTHRMRVAQARVGGVATNTFAGLQTPEQKDVLNRLVDVQSLFFRIMAAQSGFVFDNYSSRLAGNGKKALNVGNADLNRVLRTDAFVMVFNPAKAVADILTATTRYCVEPQNGSFYRAYDRSDERSVQYVYDAAQALGKTGYAMHSGPAHTIDSHQTSYLPVHLMDPGVSDTYATELQTVFNSVTPRGFDDRSILEQTYEAPSWQGFWDRTQ